MKDRFFWAALAFGLLYFFSGFLIRENAMERALRPWKEAPVLHGGRLKPVDTVARTSLLMLRGKQTLRDEDERRSAARWLAELIASPEKADRRAIFRIDNPDVLGLVGQGASQEKYYSFETLRPHARQIASQAQRANDVESVLRSPYQRAVIRLSNGLTLYQRLKNAFHLPGTPSLLEEMKAFEAFLPKGLEAVHRQMSGDSADEPSLALLSAYFEKYSFLGKAAPFAIVPPREKDGPSEDWSTFGNGLRDRMRREAFSPSLSALAGAIDAMKTDDPQAIRTALEKHDEILRESQPKAVFWSSLEESFNRIEPFYRAIVLYVLALLLACLSWIALPKTLTSAAFGVLIAAFFVHTAGLLCRMLLEGRPPVTNLYSSAVFVGWASVLLSLFLERMHGQGLGSAAGAALGFSSLIVAHHLTGSGDTMEMMRAVLDSNFWLGTHVVTITIGYSATFLAGFLAHIYIFRGSLTRNLPKKTAKTLVSMAYGIICFATLFSFVGTVLGGIWADQSWGRFWGWDPKENGALLIVLWNAWILHARWGGFLRDRGLMVCAVFGNVITSLSWFGVNMLGIGLHSYGFMDKAAFALGAFGFSQAAVMGLGLRNPKRWKSSRIF